MTDNDKTRLKIAAPEPFDIADRTRLRSDDAVSRLESREKTRLSPARGNPGNYKNVIVGEGDTIKQRFVLDRLLGVGGMGAVYRALDLRKQEASDDRPYVAIKVLGEEFKNHPQALITLQREAKKTQDLAHPNIVTVYDFDRDGELIYLTMEELQGHSLKEVLDAKPGAPILDFKQKLRVVREISAGLAYAHSKGIVHSDLKPGNIFVTETGNIKILDFGIARAANEEIYQDSFDAGELGAVTYRYASPEMLRFDAPHPSDDIYALGVIACEILGGNHPFSDLDALAAQEQKMQPKLPRIHNPLLKRVLTQSLCLTRSARLADASVFYKRLHSAQAGPRRLAWFGVVLVTAVLANYGYIQSVKPPTVALSELSPELQESFRSYLAESSRALSFGDLQGAVVNIDRAFQIHSTNNDVKSAIAEVVEIVEATADAQGGAEKDEAYGQQIEQLKRYAAFADQFASD